MVDFFVILDGAGDRATAKRKTPFEAANTPNLDFLANNGLNGLVYTVGKDIAPESDAAISALLGYDPYTHYTGRGPLEAVGAGVKFHDGDLALRTNFSTYEYGTISDRRAGRNISPAEGAALENTINRIKLREKGVSFTFKQTEGHRGVVVFRSKHKLSRNITNTDPAYKQIIGPGGVFGAAKEVVDSDVDMCLPIDDSPASLYSSRIVNDFVQQCYAVLSKHPVNKKRKNAGLPPANFIITRDPGIKAPSFNNLCKTSAKKWAAVVAMPLEIGITSTACMKVMKFKYPKFKGTTQDHALASLAAEVKAAKESTFHNLDVFDAFFIHFKQTDIAGHDGDYELKKKMIEFIDKEFFGPLLHKVDLNNTRIIVTCDHATPCADKGHSADPVPLTFYNAGKSKDDVKKFGETHASKGLIGTIQGKDVMKLFSM